MRKLIVPSLAAAAFLALTGAASAVTTLTLTQTFGDSLGPQSTSNPCVIAGSTCQQPADFGYNNFVQGNTQTIDAFSSSIKETLADNVEGAVYTVGQIINALEGATAFNIALDVNASGAATDSLNLFRVRIGGALAYEYDPGPAGPVGSTNVATGINNGNGFGDWSLGTVNLAGLDLDTSVIFFAAMTQLTDGAESFFITRADVTPIPIPGALLMMAPVLGLGGGAAWWRKRRQKKELPATHAYAA